MSKIFTGNGVKNMPSSVKKMLFNSQTGVKILLHKYVLRKFIRKILRRC